MFAADGTVDSTAKDPRTATGKSAGICKVQVQHTCRCNFTRRSRSAVGTTTVARMQGWQAWLRIVLHTCTGTIARIPQNTSTCTAAAPRPETCTRNRCTQPHRHTIVPSYKHTKRIALLQHLQGNVVLYPTPCRRIVPRAWLPANIQQHATCEKPCCDS